MVFSLLLQIKSSTPGGNFVCVDETVFLKDEITGSGVHKNLFITSSLVSLLKLLQMILYNI